MNTSSRWFEALIFKQNLARPQGSNQQTVSRNLSRPSGQHHKQTTSHTSKISTTEKGSSACSNCSTNHSIMSPNVMDGVVQITRSPPIHIPDSFKGYPVSSFCLQHVPSNDLESVLIPGGLVKDRIERLGFDISADFTREDFTLLCVLKGGFQFFNELLQVIRQYHRFNADQSQENIKNGKARRIQAEFIRLVSYEDDSSKGYVKIIGLENLSSLRDRNVLIVEDIIDSGLTMQTLLKALEKEQPKMVKVAALFFKRTPKNTGNYYPDYVGFSIPDSFIVGCNLDYNNYFRDLQHVCVISNEGKERYRLSSDTISNGTTEAS